MNNIKLSEYLLEITKGTTPTTIGGRFTSEGVNFVKAECLNTGRIIDRNSLSYISSDIHKKLSRSILKEGDLLFSIAGHLGKMAIVRKIDLPANTNQAVAILRINQNKANVEFLYYYLCTKQVSEFIESQCAQSVQPNLNLAQVGELPIIEYSLSEQQKIASVLSALDAKIELNNRINAELEAMAKTLYDYWFVQFDFPFDFAQGKPDANGKPYKTNGGKMVWNEELKREIPEGWEVEGIEKSCSIIDCLHSKKSDFVFEDESSFLLQLENLKDDGLIDLTSKYYVTKVEYKRWTSRIEVKENDILITNAGRVAATAQMPKDIVSGIGRNITAIRPKKVRPNYLFLSFRGADIKRQIRLNTDSGAFFTSFNVKGIKKLQILRPKNNIEEKFEELVHPIRQKRELNNLENQKLTELRDWLLPMLMNGQVKVK